LSALLQVRHNTQNNLQNRRPAQLVARRLFASGVSDAKGRIIWASAVIYLTFSVAKGMAQTDPSS